MCQIRYSGDSVEVKESAIRPNKAQRAGATKPRNKSLRTDSGSFRLECCP